MSEEYILHELKNGLPVLFIPFKGIDSVLIELHGEAGARFEEQNEIGIAHFLEHLLHDGTKKYPNREQITGLIENLGGARNASTSHGSVNYWAKTLKEDFDKGLEYLSQILLNPLLNQKDIDKEKNIITQEIFRSKDSLGGFIGELIIKTLFGNHRLGKMVLGEVEDIKNITKQSVTSYFEKNYNANNFILTAVGDLKADELLEKAEKYFSKMKKGNPTKYKKPTLNNKYTVTTGNRPHLQQATVEIYFFGPNALSKDKYANFALDNILGSGCNSRLFRKIRTELELAYSINSGVSSNKDYGLFYISFGVEQDKINQTISAVFSELKKIKKEGVSKEELEKAKKITKTNFAFYYEKPSNRADYYSYNYKILGKIITPKEEMALIDSVVLEDVNRIANQVFSDPPKITIVSKSFTEKDLSLTTTL